ncbi:MAG: hypothetical protein L6420_01665 [Elusimicrobia bacterium]|nr:hypothetical protein [Elusimicrobiota bacterium]
MKWHEFLRKVGGLPVINTEILLAGVINTNPIKVQISRWEKSGKIIQLKRGFYILSDEYRKIVVHPQYIASVLKTPSYISLEKALEYYNLIPEAVHTYTSVTAKRSARYASKFGIFEYRHIKTSLFWGYNSIELNKQTRGYASAPPLAGQAGTNGQIAFIAEPEKALLDFFYLNKTQVSNDYISEMRLQNLDGISTEKMFEYAEKYKSKRIAAVCEMIGLYIKNYKRSEKQL